MKAKLDQDIEKRALRLVRVLARKKKKRAIRVLTRHSEGRGRGRSGQEGRREHIKGNRTKAGKNTEDNVSPRRLRHDPDEKGTRH